LRIRILVLYLLLTCFTGGAVAYGRTQVGKQSLYGLTKCDGFPCFMSLDFHKNTHGSMYNRILSLPGTRMKSEDKVRIDVTVDGFGYEVSYSGDVYAGIVLVPSSKKLTLAEFINFYGEPCGMSTGEPIPTTILMYRSMAVVVEFEGTFLTERLYQTTPIQQIFMWNPYSENNLYYRPCNDMKWKGFSSLSSYWRSGLVWPGD
jgi:hypothetical protein